MISTTVTISVHFYCFICDGYPRDRVYGFFGKAYQTVFQNGLKCLKRRKTMIELKNLHTRKRVPALIFNRFEMLNSRFGTCTLYSRGLVLVHYTQEESYYIFNISFT